MWKFFQVVVFTFLFFVGIPGWLTGIKAWIGWLKMNEWHWWNYLFVAIGTAVFFNVTYPFWSWLALKTRGSGTKRKPAEQGSFDPPPLDLREFTVKTEKQYRDDKLVGWEGHSDAVPSEPEQLEDE